MLKDAYYFSHDSNARHDPKLVTLCQKFTLLGYAYFFIMIELLREQGNYKMPRKFTPAIAMAWHGLSQAQATEIIDEMVTLELLLEDAEGNLFSPSLNQRMAALETRRQKLSDAGRKGGLKSSQAQARLKQPSSSKVKESKVNGSTAVLTPQSKFVTTLGQLYLKEVGTPYQANKEDYIIAKRLMDKHTEAVVKLKASILLGLCKNRSAWFTKEGMGNFTVKKLASHWNEIVAVRQEQELI